MTNEQIPASNPESQAGGDVRPVATRPMNGFLRAVLYTPVVIVLGGLAALATFPDLANYASPLIDHFPKTAMNAKCNFKCPSSSQSIDLSNPVYQQSAGCCEMGNALAKRFAPTGLGCCEDASPVSAQPNQDGALAMVITEDTTSESPADASEAANIVAVDQASN